MLTVAISKRNKLQNIIVLTPKDGFHLTVLLTLLKSPFFSPPAQIKNYYNTFFRQNLYLINIRVEKKICLLYLSFGVE